MQAKIDNILFDLDGTLTDSKLGIINSILYSLCELDIHESNINKLNTFIGSPLRESFASQYRLSENMADKAVSAFREYFSTKGLFENQLYLGVEDMLKSLSSQDFKLFVATSKPTVFAKQILQHFGLDKYFIEIAGSSLDKTLTDKTEIISKIVTCNNLQAKNSLMVGDRKYDIIAAKNNSMTTMAVTYGYGSLQELSLYCPDYTVINCEEIVSTVIKINSA